MDTGLQRNNVEQNEENVDIIPPVPMSSAGLSLHAEDVVLVDTPRGARMENDVVRSSQVISHTIEGISSICPVDSNITSGARQMEMDDRYRGLPRTSTHNRRDSSDSSDTDSDTDRVPRGRGYSYERGRPPERERYSSRDRRPPIRRGAPSNGGPPDRGRPPDRGGPPSGGGPPDGGGPPSDGGSSNGNGGPPSCPNRRGTPGPRGPPGPVRPVLIQQPQVI